MQIRTKFLTLLFLLNLAISFSQNISLSELVNLKDLDVGNAKKYLESKNWKTGAERKQTDKYNQAIFFKDDIIPDSETQKLIFFIYSTDKDYPSRINAQLDKIGFDLCISKMESLGFKFITSRIEEGMKIEIFQNKSKTIKASQSTDKTNSDLFYIFILDNSDYFRNVHEETNTFKKL